jgi:hypothetical protein
MARKPHNGITPAQAQAEIVRRATNRAAKRDARLNGTPYTPIRVPNDELLKLTGAELLAIAS